MYSYILIVQCLILINAIIFQLAMQVLDYQRIYFAAAEIPMPRSIPTPTLNAVV
jgi:hypothetical protein